MQIIGYATIKNEFTSTKFFPDGRLGYLYKKALAGKRVPVLEIAVDASGYLVIGTINDDDIDANNFLWCIEKGDIDKYEELSLPSIKDLIKIFNKIQK